MRSLERDIVVRCLLMTTSRGYCNQTSGDMALHETETTTILPCITGEPYPYPDPPPPTVTQNFTYPFDNDAYPVWEVGLKATAYAIAMAMAIIGNLMVMITIIMIRHHIQLSATLYLFNLAVSDLLIGAINMWVHLLTGIQSNWPFGNVLCKVYHFLQITFLTASILFMTILAVDRFIAVVYPLKWRLSEPYQHTLVIILTWLLSATVSVPFLMYRQSFELYWADQHQVWCDEQWPRYPTEEQPEGQCTNFIYPGRQIYYNFLVIVMYMIPVLVLIFTYSVILWRIKERRVPAESTQSTLPVSTQNCTKRAVRMMVAILIVFILSWTMQESVVFMDANWPEWTQENLSEDLRYIAIYIAYFNSSLNPFLYLGLGVNDRLRQVLVTTLHCRRNKVAPATVQDTAGFVSCKSSLDTQRKQQQQQQQWNLSNSNEMSKTTVADNKSTSNGYITSSVSTNNDSSETVTVKSSTDIRQTTDST